MRISAFVFLAIMPNALFAWSVSDRIAAAQAMADIIASEAPCGLEYDQSAIAAYIDKTVPADDMEFTSSLNARTKISTYSIESMTESALTAHCRQVERVAASYGFVPG